MNYKKRRGKSKIAHYGKGGKVVGPLYEDPRGKMRSESTEHEKARRTIQHTPPVTVLEDVIGRFDKSKGHNNALRDAIRRKAFDDMEAAGGRPGRRGYEYD